MKHIIEEWGQNIYESALWNFYFGGMRVGVLDIETTGLYPARNKFILGCLYDAGRGELHQVLAESRAEEAEALAEYIRLIEDVDIVVTYNGKRFDMPFIEQRRRLTGAWDRPVTVYNLDLFLVLKGYSPIRQLVPNMKQKTIENDMGLWNTRTDEITGAESVDLYNHYEATGDREAERKILLHNNDDVRQLTKLTKAVIKSDFHRAMNGLGFPVKAGGNAAEGTGEESLLLIESITLRKDTLTYGGQYSGPGDYIGFEYNGRPVHWEFKDGKFSVNVPVIRQDGLAIIDIEAAGVNAEAFSDYPGYGSGFIVIADERGNRPREMNRFIQIFTAALADSIQA